VRSRATASTRGNLRQRRGRGAATSGGGNGDDSASDASISNKSPQEIQREEFQRRMKEIQDSIGDTDDQAPLVKLGDASIASPFTSRRMTIDSCVSIIRQGRCTLATTMQMYQILALNCLISAYSLSVLYLEGVMFGDKQMTITGLIMAIAFFLILRSKPLKKLSVQRPPISIFSPELFISLLGQFAVHVVALIYCTRMATGYEPYGPSKNIDSTFRPSVVNTVVFLLSIAQQVSAV
jgi:manganese-transporting P-type ATPase